MVLFIVSGKKYTSIRNLTLTTHSSSDCGGYNVWIEIEVGNQICNTTKIDSFSAGDTLLWFGKYLGSCRKFQFDSNLDSITFKIKTIGGDDYCPKYFYAFMDSIAFKSELMTDWYEEDTPGSYHDTNHRIHLANRTSEAFILPLTGK